MEGDFVPWKPTEITVVFFAIESEQGALPPWPSEWPIPQFPTESDGKVRDWSFVKLDISKLDQVRKFFGSTEQGGFRKTEFLGKKFKVYYRYQFPGEEIWCKFDGPPEIVEIESFIKSPAFPPDVPKPVVRKNAFEP